MHGTKTQWEHYFDCNLLDSFIEAIMTPTQRRESDKIDLMAQCCFVSLDIVTIAADVIVQHS